MIYNPIGLTDTRYQRPWQTADEAYKRTMSRRRTSFTRRTRPPFTLFPHAGRVEAGV